MTNLQNLLGYTNTYSNGCCVTPGNSGSAMISQQDFLRALIGGQQYGNLGSGAGSSSFNNPLNSFLTTQQVNSMSISSGLASNAESSEALVGISQQAMQQAVENAQVGADNMNNDQVVNNAQTAAKAAAKAGKGFTF